jgi:hypothetical protein
VRMALVAVGVIDEIILVEAAGNIVAGAVGKRMIVDVRAGADVFVAIGSSVISITLNGKNGVD